MTHWSRRRFVSHLLTLVAAGETLPLLHGAAVEKPEIHAWDPSLLDEWLTRNELFFVRENLPMPHVESAAWRLRVGGAVERTGDLTLTDLQQHAFTELPVTLECASNPVGGGMVGNARWGGARLTDVLQQAVLKPGVRAVRLWGTDADPKTQHRYQRTLPIEKALHTDTLIVWRMNGEPLPPKHGGTARAIVPGWYGMDSVKWLAGIEVLTDADPVPLTDQAYTRQRLAAEGMSVQFEPVREGLVKSLFARPLDGARLSSRRFVVRGAAWAGERKVARVEVSADSGKSWNHAELLPGEGRPPQPYAWVQWTWVWAIPGPGNYALTVRATDDAGRVQPETRPAGRLDQHEMNHYQQVRCTVL